MPSWMSLAGVAGALLLLGFRGLAEDPRPVWGIDDPRAPEDMELLQQFRSLTGIDPTIVTWRVDFSQSFPEERCSKVWRSGRLPLILWDPELPDDGQSLASRSKRMMTLEGILMGNHDAYLRAWAEEAARHAQPVLIHFLRQFNHSAHAWSIGANGRDPSRIKEAFKKVVRLFQECGAENVRWVWGPHVFPSPAAGWNQWEKAYPGDDFVDFVALDGLDFGEAGLVSLPLSFEQLFAAPVRQLRRLSPRRPILLTSVGTSLAHPSREKWLRNMAVALAGPLSSVRGVVWFNYVDRVRWQAQEGDRLGLQRLIYDPPHPTVIAQLLERIPWPLNLLPPQRAPAPPPRPWKVPYVPQTDFSKIPSALRGTPMLHLEFPAATLLGRELEKKERFAARFRLGWNSRALLVWCEVDDSTLGESRWEPEQIWDGDGLELAIGPPDQASFAEWEGSRLLISPGGPRQTEPSLAWIRMKDGSLHRDTDGILFHSQFGVTTPGYRLFGIIPWKPFGIAPSPGAKIPFDLSVTDGAGGRRVRQWVWSGGPHAYHDPSEWGCLDLLSP